MGSLVSSTNAADGRRLVANKPIEVALNEIVTRARVFTDAGGAAIALRDGDYLITRASSGNIAPDVGARNAVEGSLTGQAVLKGVPIHIEDSDKDPRVDAEICRQLNTRSFIVTPIAGSTTMLGVLAVFASAPSAFTRTDLAVLRTMADQIATALGGGAFIQQVWPGNNGDESESAAPVQSEPEPVQQAPEPPKPQAQKVETPKYEPPTREQPKYEAPKPEPVRQKPAIADVQCESLEEHLDVLESDPIVIPEKVRNRENAPVKVSARVAPTVERPKPAPIPQMQPEPVRERIEPIAQPTEEPKLKKTEVPARPVKVSAQTPVTKKDLPKHEIKEPPKAKSDEGVSRDEIKAPATSVDAIGGRSDKSTAAKPETAVAQRKGTVEWKGLSAEQEPESNSMKKIIIGVVAALIVVGAVAAGMMMKKSSATPPQPAVVASTPASAIPAASATAPAAAPTATPATTTASQPRVAAVTSTTPTATAPAAKPTQPGIVIAPGSAPRQNSAVEDQAPPQLAFSGGAPQLAGSNAAMPKRAASDPTPAQVIRRVSPTYPDIARRTRQRGSVELQTEVRKDGSVGRVDVISGPMLLRQAAIDAVKQWRYRPAQLSGMAVDSSVRVTIDFTPAQ